MKKFLSLLLVGAMVLGLVACGGAASSSEAAPASSSEAAPASSSEAAPASSSEAASSEAAAPEGEKVLYTNQGAVEFFQVPWFNANYPNDNKLVYETLVGTDANDNLTTSCGMSDSYVQADDGMTFTVHLRDGLQWHDGEPVTADDVVFSIEAGILDGVSLVSTIKNTWKCLEGAEEYLAGAAEHISGIQVADDGRTITFKFASVAPNQVFAFGEMTILPKHLLENADFAAIQQDPYFQKPIGSGPFMIDEVKMGEYTIYVPNPNYWDGVADFTIHQLANDPESDPNLVTRFRAGQIDYAMTKLYDDVRALQDVEGCTITPVSILYTRWLNVNEFKRDENDVNPLHDARVRQAIAYAIDRKAIAEGLFEGAVNPGDGTLTPTGHAWKNTNGLETYDYNPEKAKELLAEAGWDSSRVLKVVYYYQDQGTADLMAIIQQYLADVGIQIEPSLLTGDLPTLLNSPPSDWTEDGIKGVDWDLCYGALAATTTLNYYERFLDNGTNNAHPVTQEMRDLTAALFGTANPDEQKAAYAAFEEWQSKEMKIIPLYYSPYWIVTSDKIAGNVEKWGNPQFLWDWKIQNWELK
ncbi:MAG: ABC transporter substrate-binding protein [Lachnospiraceae bacterium]|nr:ABC transporter substrate-binding protein [Lachnospiraceae bacterium]